MPAVNIPLTTNSVRVPTVVNEDPTTVGPRVVLFRSKFDPALKAAPSDIPIPILDCKVSVESSKRKVF